MPYPVAAARGGHTRNPVAAAGNGLLNNLVGYWAMDEAGGANDALDKHSNSLTLTQYNSPGNATGIVYSTARTQDVPPSEKYFLRASETLLHIGDNDATVAGWIYMTTVSLTQVILAKYVTTTGNREFELMYNNTDASPNNNFMLRVSAAGTSSSAVAQATNFGAASINTWYFVVGWHDSVNNQIGICVNNGTPNTVSYSSGVYIGTAAFGTSINTTTYICSGRLGPLMMWKSTGGNGGVLTAAQRTALYNAGAGLAYASFTM